METVVIGAGGLAREVIRILAMPGDSGTGDDLSFVGCVTTLEAAHPERETEDLILGDLEWLHANSDNIDAVVIAVGSPSARAGIAEKVAELCPDVIFPPVIHPSVGLIREDSNSVGEGTIIEEGAIATVNIRIGRFCYVGYGTTIGHETQIHDFAQVNPGAVISGGVSIGKGSLVGAGATVLEYRSVGAGATIGAGAVVTKDVAASTTVVGIPARETSASNT